MKYGVLNVKKWLKYWKPRLMTNKQIEEEIADILMDIELIASSEEIVQTTGVLFRVNPKWAKNKAKVIVKVLKR